MLISNGYDAAMGDMKVLFKLLMSHRVTNVTRCDFGSLITVFLRYFLIDLIASKIFPLQDLVTCLS